MKRLFLAVIIVLMTSPLFAATSTPTPDLTVQALQTIAAQETAAVETMLALSCSPTETFTVSQTHTVSPTITETWTVSPTLTITPTITRTHSVTPTCTTTPGSILWSSRSLVIKHVTVTAASGQATVFWPDFWHWADPYMVQLQAISLPVGAKAVISSKAPWSVTVAIVDFGDGVTAVDCSSTSAVVDIFIYYEMGGGSQ